MTYTIITAYDLNYGIGDNGKLPWHLPEDLQWFKEITTNHIIIMGGNTFRSFNYQPLPNRTNIVLTKEHANYGPIYHDLILGGKNPNQKDLWFVSDIKYIPDIMKHTRLRTKHRFVIGGAQIYKLFLDENLIDTMYVTKINNTYKCDTYFPIINDNKWIKRLLYQTSIYQRLLYTYKNQSKEQNNAKN